MHAEKIKQWAAKQRIPAPAMTELLAIFEQAVCETAPVGGRSEAEVQKQLRLKAQELGGQLWRNNSGVAREPARDKSGREYTRYVRYGLGNTSAALNRNFKSADLIGIMPALIEESHVGRRVGVFTAVEVKNPNWRFNENRTRDAAQNSFLTVVRGYGGFACFATCENDFIRNMQLPKF